jgi:hypothetical protein
MTHPSIKTYEYFRGQKEYWERRCRLAERCINGDAASLREWKEFVNLNK